MVGLDEARLAWSAALEELALQMTKPTFETWLKRSEVVGVEGETMIVQVQHAYAIEWLEHRLRGTIERTLARHAPGMGVVFVAQGEPEGQPQRAQSSQREELHPHPDPLRRPETAGSGKEGDDVELEVVTLPELVAFEQAASARIRKRGFAQLTNYALRFWSELLGPTAFLCWATAFANDKRDKRDLCGLSQPVRFSVARLARVAAQGRVQAVRGVWRKCRHQEMEGMCCGRYPERATTIGPDGVCRYWQAGAFDVLRAEQVGTVHVHSGQGWEVWDPQLEIGGALARRRYWLRVYMPLPLLTPAQVARLDPVSQDEHEVWLVQAGLDVEAWERLTVATFGMISARMRSDG